MQARTLGPYVLETRLGAGGFGAVWVGRHQESGARHALKVIELATAEEALRFQREAEALARLAGHPALVRVHAAFNVGATAVLVTELIEGPGDLEGRLKRAGPLSPERAASLVLEVARAVAHAHAVGVVHRDIKPANVLLDAEERPRLVDLGLATVSGERSLTRTGEIMGTPAYAAPEQARGERGDARTDVFGLGALLFACLTGRAPREGGTAMALLVRAATEAVAPVESLRPEAPRALCAIVARATALTPAERYASAADLASALERASSGRRGPPLATLAVVAFAAAVAVLVAALVWGRAGTAEEPMPVAAAQGQDAVFPAMRRFRSSPDDAAAIGSAAGELREVLVAAPGSAPPTLAADVLEAQARLARWTLDQRGSPAKLDDEVGRARRSLEALGEIAGVTTVMLLERRREALDALHVECARRLLRATDQDARDANDDQYRPAPETYEVMRSLERALGAPPGGRIGGELAGMFESVISELTGRLSGLDRATSGWQRGVRVLLALEAYRFYWLDSTASAAFRTWTESERQFPQHVRGWAHLVMARTRVAAVVPDYLDVVDPELYARQPRSRLLVVGELKRQVQGPLDEIAQGLDLARAVSALLDRDPALIDEVAGEEDVQVKSDLRVCAYALKCVYWLARRLVVAGRADEGRALIEGVLPALERCRLRFVAIEQVDHELIQMECTLGRELARNLGRFDRIAPVVERRRASVETLTRVGGSRLAAQSRVRLAADLRLMASLAPTREQARAALEEALTAAREARKATTVADKDVGTEALVAEARILLALHRLVPETPLEAVTSALALAHSEAIVETTDGETRGDVGLFLVEAALARGEKDEARRQIAQARHRAREHTDWGTEIELSALERELDAR